VGTACKVKAFLNILTHLLPVKWSSGWGSLARFTIIWFADT
jgi:hypothetical protein